MRVSTSWPLPKEGFSHRTWNNSKHRGKIGSLYDVKTKNSVLAFVFLGDLQYPVSVFPEEDRPPPVTWKSSTLAAIWHWLERENGVYHPKCTLHLMPSCHSAPLCLRPCLEHFAPEDAPCHKVCYSPSSNLPEVMQANQCCSIITPTHPATLTVHFLFSFIDGGLCVFLVIFLLIYGMIFKKRREISSLCHIEALMQWNCYLFLSFSASTKLVINYSLVHFNLLKQQIHSISITSKQAQIWAMNHFANWSYRKNSLTLGLLGRLVTIRIKTENVMFF